MGVDKNEFSNIIIVISLDKLNELMINGEFKRALEIIDNNPDRDDFALVKSAIYLRTGEYIKSVKNSNLIFTRTNNIIYKLEATFHKINALMMLGIYDEFSDLFNLADEMLTEIDESHKDYNVVMARYNFTKGNAFSERGSLTRSLECYKVAKKYAMLANMESLYSSILSNIAFVYTQKGELKIASKYFMQLLNLVNDEKETWKYMILLINLAKLHFLRNNIDIALDYIKKARKLLEVNPVVTSIVEALLLLIRIHIHKGELEQAKEYNNELQSYKNTTNKRERHYIYIGEALILKNAIRLKVKLKSYNLLKFLIEEEIADKDISFLAMKNYCELLIDEFRASKDDDILDELIRVIYRMHDLATSLDSYINIIDSLLILSKTRFIQGELEKSIDLIEEAIQVSDNNGLLTLKIVAENELESMKDMINKWKSVTNEDSGVMERLKQSEIIDYLKKVSIMDDI